MKLFVPGRLCLFGEHSDWAGQYRTVRKEIEPGHALISGTNQGIYAEVDEHPGSLLLSSTLSDGTRRGPHEIPMEPEGLRAEAERGGFWSYMAGVAHSVILRHPVRGLVIENSVTDLPAGKGLSSSAAACVLTARAFNRVYDLGLSIRDEMELAYEGEITTPSRCGRMDQGCAFGGRPVLMIFDGDRLDVSALPVGKDLHLVLVDLCSKKNTTEILSRLHRSFPLPASAVDRGVQDLLGRTNQRIVFAAADAMRSGDGERLGALMVEAQALFDLHAMPACPEELTAPALHRVLGHDAIQPHLWGGKGVGSQGDGSAQLLVRSPADQDAVVTIVERELRMPCLRLTIGASPEEAP